MVLSKINNLKVMKQVKFLCDKYVYNMYKNKKSSGLFQLLWDNYFKAHQPFQAHSCLHCSLLPPHIFSSPFLSQLCFSIQFLFYFYLHPPIPLATFSAWWVYSCFSSLKGGTDEEKVSRSLRMLVSDWRHFCVIASLRIWSSKSQ